MNIKNLVIAGTILLAVAPIFTLAASTDSTQELAYLGGEREAAKMENAAKVYQEILESINEENEGVQLAVPKTSSFAAPRLNTASKEVRQFFDEVRFEIGESVEFPAQLKGTGQKAIVVVEFQLDVDGALRSVAVCGEDRGLNPAFEQGAVNAVRRAVEFFPPVPREIDPQQVKFKIPIIFEDA